MDPYRVPWQIVRLAGEGQLQFINTGDETLVGLTVTLVGKGLLVIPTPIAVVPGGTVDVTVRGRDLARSSLLFIGWLRPNGDDYIWRVSF